jgi:Bacterial regulatory helix-turn-helix protein, lysR family
MTTPQIPLPSRRYLRNGMLPQLAAFEAVVRLGSATRAAEALCVAQPTLSGQLRKLSEALGVRLFALQGKRLVPTDAALVLLQTAREVFAALDRCEPALAGLRSSGPPALVASTPGVTTQRQPDCTVFGFAVPGPKLPARHRTAHDKDAAHRRQDKPSPPAARPHP